MRLDDLFTLIAHHAVSTADREIKYDMLRTLIKHRKDIGIDNDANELVTKFDTIKNKLGNHYEGDDIDQNLKDLIAYQTMAMSDDDEEDETTTDDSEETTSSTDDSKITTDTESDESTVSEDDDCDTASDASEYYEVIIQRDPFVYSLLFVNLVVGIAVLLKVW